jgi:S1-C subfamily serine protease
MKSSTKIFLLALILQVTSGLHAQTFDDAVVAYKRGEYSLAYTGFKTAADQGDPIAQGILGVMFSKGQGVQKDPKLAYEWHRKSGEQGNVKSQFWTGVALANGDGVAKDDQMAIQWYRKAADQGEAFSQYELGRRFESGRGIPKDEKQAVYWYSRAANQGDAEAQMALGAKYWRGVGVIKDQQTAYFWWLLAAAQGDEDAMRFRDNAEKVITVEQRATAQQNARNWKPSALTGGSTGGRDEVKNEPSQAAATVQPDSTGSGFRIASNTIVTNHHVVDGCQRLRVNDAAAQTRSSDLRGDLALIGVTSPGPVVKLRSQRTSVGEAVAVAGYPLRGVLSGFNMTTGSVSSMSGIGGDTRLLQISAPVQPGNSGGPVLDSAANLMGVVISKLDAIKAAKLTGDIPQNVNFAIGANSLRSFLDANNVEYETASSDKSILSTDVAERAKGFTVLVECWK